MVMLSQKGKPPPSSEPVIWQTTDSPSKDAFLEVQCESVAIANVTLNAQWKKTMTELTG